MGAIQVCPYFYETLEDTVVYGFTRKTLQLEKKIGEKISKLPVWGSGILMRGFSDRTPALQAEGHRLNARNLQVRQGETPSEKPGEKL